MIRAPIVDVAQTHLSELCADGAPETGTLEFKRELPERSDRGRAEFLKDVAAFANSAGGDIVFGIEEADGVASQVVPITGETADESTRRLGQLLDSAIEPKLNGVSIKAVNLDSGGYALIVRVPGSSAGPHRYHFNGHTRFVIRDHNRVRDMAFSEIRNSFLRFAGNRERARAMREDAIRRVSSRTTAKRLIEGPVCAVQVIPLGHDLDAQAVDLTALNERWTTLIMDGWGGGSNAFNLDGLIVYPSGGDDGLYSYVQVYRNGSVEAFSYAGHFSFQSTVPSVGLADFIRDAIGRALAVTRLSSITGPAAVFVTLINVDGYKLGLGNGFYFRQEPISDRPIISVPDLLIEELGQIENTEEVIKPILDIIWQAFGISGCGFYNEAGEWAPPR